MYDDCWGEVGWTIVDYYLRRKPSWYAVRRALSPRRLMLRRGAAGACKIILCNECGSAFDGEIEYGWVSYDGRERKSAKVRVSLRSAERRTIAEMDMAGRDESKGCFFALCGDTGSGIEAAILRPSLNRPFMALAASPKVSELRRDPDGSVKFLVSSPVFAHGVHFHLGEGIHPSDEYFDLLPGESREIKIAGPLPGPGLPAIEASALNRGH